MRFYAIFLFIIALLSVGCERIPTIEITSTPSGATVFIDGVEVGTTPYKDQATLGTTYKVMVSKRGYHAATAALKHEGGKLSRALQLKKLSLSDMILIPAGKFIMGTSDEEEALVTRQLGGGEIVEHPRWFKSEKPQQEVYLDAFYIDEFEVTNADYQEFIDATGYPAPRHWANRKYPEGEDELPVVYVNWKDANAYCRWSGKRLPTEAEWEKAARGTDARIWPWGNEFDITKCNVESWEGSGPKPVGSHSQCVSPYGVYDMAGNVWEWTDSWYDAYPGSTFRAKEFGQKYRVLRGGSWYYYDSLNPIGARTPSRDIGTEDHLAYIVGFRCAIGQDEVALEQ